MHERGPREASCECVRAQREPDATSVAMASDEALSSEARAHTKQLFADKVSEQRTVVIKGLGKHMLLSALCTHLEPAGSIEEVKRVRKTAFVTYSTAAQAALAIERLNNRELQGQPLQIFLLGGPGWEPPSMQAVMETDAIYASGHGDGPAEGVGVNDPEIASSSTATTMHTDASIAQGDASALHGNVRGDPARKQVSENKVSEHEGPHEQGHARGFTGGSVPSVSCHLIFEFGSIAISYWAHVSMPQSSVPHQAFAAVASKKEQTCSTCTSQCRHSTSVSPIFCSDVAKLPCLISEHCPSPLLTRNLISLWLRCKPLNIQEQPNERALRVRGCGEGSL